MQSREDLTTVSNEDNNKVISEMITSENTYNEKLGDLGVALTLDVNVGQDVLLLQLREVVFKLKGISDTLLLNAKVAYDPQITSLDAHLLLRVQRVSLLKSFYTEYKEYLKLYDGFMVANKADPERFKTIKGYFTLNSKSFKNLSLDDYLIEPIQRGFRYQLLINEALGRKDGLTEQNLKELNELLGLVKGCMQEVNSSSNLASINKGYQFGDLLLKPVGKSLYSWWYGSSAASDSKTTLEKESSVSASDSDNELASHSPENV
ncbi:RhoGEF domain-containing protein [Legionella shakespearei]|uniref:RhoGEF domain protein n=1 Tax=Legionella shakespearei DSM 23087 TaxID=1122169 RepID=A0A0W0YVA3_9GAMM|nr:RhoGEF domain-containing protein [Legionella shakespearei]KTD60792.1 RhoGEF domain protein [Legionella shakespearei DSM 23087]